MLKLTEAFDMVYRDFSIRINQLKLTTKQQSSILRRLQHAQNKAMKKYYDDNAIKK